jgi:hypothetical protein
MGVASADISDDHPWKDASQMARCRIARSPRSRTASILLSLILLSPLANVAFAADVKFAIESVLNDAILQTQNMMGSMSQGCSGGAHGVPPQNWGSLQTHGSLAVSALNATKLALANDQSTDALRQVESAANELDALVNGARNMCSGGRSGEDPLYYGRYQAIRAAVRAKLEVVSELLK